MHKNVADSRHNELKNSGKRAIGADLIKTQYLITISNTNFLSEKKNVFGVMSYPNWHFQIREESNAWWATFRDLCKTITTFSCGISTIPLPLGGKENWIMLANYSRRFNRTQMSCQHFNIIYIWSVSNKSKSQPAA